LARRAGRAASSRPRPARARGERGAPDDADPTRLLETLPATLTALVGARTGADAPQRDQSAGTQTRHSVAASETLRDIARVRDLGFVELRAANPGIDARNPPTGGELVIPSLHQLPYDAGHRIIVNIADMRLCYFERDGG
jgi:hypothetical protein